LISPCRAFGTSIHPKAKAKAASFAPSQPSQAQVPHLPLSSACLVPVPVPKGRNATNHIASRNHHSLSALRHPRPLAARRPRWHRQPAGAATDRPSLLKRGFGSCPFRPIQLHVSQRQRTSPESGREGEITSCRLPAGLPACRALLLHGIVWACDASGPGGRPAGARLAVRPCHHYCIYVCVCIDLLDSLLCSLQYSTVRGAGREICA
jgi:hypothetical protein